MHPRTLIPLALLCFSSVVRAEPAVDLAQANLALTTALQEEIKALAADGNDRDIQSARRFLRMVQNGVQDENARQFDQWMGNLGDYQPGQKVQQAIDGYRQSIKGQAEEKTRAIVAELEGLMTSAGDQLRKATEPADLDKLVASLSRKNAYNESVGYDTNNPAIRALSLEISATRQLVTGWQDYLQASNTGNTAQALQTLRNLSNQNSSVIPRSQILARISFEQNSDDGVLKILSAIKAPEDMADGIRALGKLGGGRSSGSENPAQRDALVALSKLEKTYREFQAGLPVRVEVLQTSSDGTEPSMDSRLVGLRAAVLRMVLPRALDLPETMKPAEGESIDHFLSRAMDESVSSGETATTLRIGEMRRLLVRSANFSDKDTEALRNFAAGSSQIEGSQYMLAVVSLQTALKSGSELVPAAKTGALLESIRKDHPTEYEQGMAEFLTPRRAPDVEYPRMPYRGYYPPEMRNPDGSPRQPGTTLVLPIPARDGTKAETPPAPERNSRIPSRETPSRKAPDSPPPAPAGPGQE